MSNNMTICIENLTFDTIIGILENERITPQKVIIDAQIKIDYDKKELVNYAVISKLIKDLFIKEKFFTVEEALLFSCKKIKEKYKKIKKIKIKISKPNALNYAVVGAKLSKTY